MVSFSTQIRDVDLRSVLEYAAVVDYWKPQWDEMMQRATRRPASRWKEAGVVLAGVVLPRYSYME